MTEATRVQDNVGFLLLQSNIEKAISVLATKYQLLGGMHTVTSLYVVSSTIRISSLKSR